MILKRTLDIKLLSRRIKNLIQQNEQKNFLDELIKIENSNQVKIANLFIASIENLEKLNKIFSLYESIRSIEKIKEKVITKIKYLTITYFF